VRAIQKACAELGSFQLTNHRLVTECHCLGCLGGAFWSRPAELIVGYGDETVKRNADETLKQVAISANPVNHPHMLIPMIKIDFPEALAPFYQWRAMDEKEEY